MPWFKVDDGFWSHPKVLGLSAQAVALWVRAGSYCANHLTDGNVARGVVAVLGHSESDATELVFAGLWKNTHDGWKYNDWADYQPAREEIERQRRMKADRQKRWREAHRNQQGQFKDDRSGADSVDASVDASRDAPVDTAPTRPDPTRPKVLKEHMLTQSASEFDEFWSAYPRKIGKRKAHDAYRSAIKRTDAATIQSAAERLRDDPNLPDKQFIPHPSTWLNRDGWNDEPCTPRIDSRGPSGSEIFATLDPQLVDHAAATLNGHSTRKAINA